MFKIGILALVLLFVIGCGPDCKKPRDYELEITYMHGDKDTVSMTCYSCNGNPPYLDEGCIRDYSGDDFSCYVRSFKILKSIDK